METIIVEPVAAGWAVRADRIENDLVFRSGADAEDAARALALRLAATGEPVRLRFSINGTKSPRRFVCVPPVETGDCPRLVQLASASGGA